MKKSEITRKRILDAAEAEFAEKGLYGTRVDEIAARSGINKRMMYVYFGNKEELYMTILKTVYSRLTEYEEKLFASSNTGVAAVRDEMCIRDRRTTGLPFSRPRITCV